MEIQNWLNKNLISYEIIGEKIVIINNKKYLIIDEKNDGDDKVIFTREFDFFLNDEELEIIKRKNIDYLIFEFGKKVYYSTVDKVELNILKYIGTSNISLNIDLPYLGVHGGYELCNGSRDYSDWCKKANFLGIKTLGLSELNTLAGTLHFQESCKKFNIKPIIGETVSVIVDETTEYKVKLYCKNNDGWVNLLNINAEVNVFSENKKVKESTVLKRSDGLICVLEGELNKTRISKFKKIFKEDLYYKVDFVKYSSNNKDQSNLLLIQEYFKNYLEDIKPVLICDSYYLDKDDYIIKQILNKAGGISFQYQSQDQFFKDQDYIYNQILELFNNDDEELAQDLLFGLIENLNELESKCLFEIETNSFKLPKYVFSKDEEQKYSNEEEMFLKIIDEGFDNLIKPVIDKNEYHIYKDRIKEELEVIKEGGFIDYFLIIRDFLNWSRENNIMTGVGRGSVGGSLIAYLIGLTQIDPIKYGLLFERFLNRGRLKVSLPDVDSDLDGSQRDKVKKYIEEKYGVDNVASIGTYSTLKIRAAIKELGRSFGIPPQTVNYITAMIEPESTFIDFFKQASENPRLKDFIQSYPDLINLIEPCFNQPKNTSIHAAGLIITPKKINNKNVTIYDQMPVKKVGDLLVTEWEGEYTEKVGFLKADVLGLRQLEKFANIIKLIKQQLDIDIDLTKIELDNQDVFELFRKGLNEDVFQFGALGLKNYCYDLQPTNIDDLIAIIALYRPGPIEIRAHIDYVNIRNGKKIPEYDYMCKEITQETGGLLIYQEQIMKVCQVLGGFDLVEADDIRKAMGKSKMEVMLSYKEKFIDGALKNKCKLDEANSIWDKMVGFANYCFNKAHSVAYALTGYRSQWLKVNYPLQFWVASLNYSSLEELPLRIFEIKKIGGINILPPDINKSQDIFISDTKTNSIYWSLDSVKQMGEVASKAFFGEREKNGRYFSFDEFLKRMEEVKVNKAVIVNLIISGCFDEIEKIKKENERIFLLKKFLDGNVPKDFDINEMQKQHFWILKQKEICGFGYIDYESIYRNNIKNEFKKSQFILGSNIDLESSIGYNKLVGGIVETIMERNSKNGLFGQVTLNHNDIPIVCIIWAELWSSFKTTIYNNAKKIIYLNGDIRFDNYKKKNILQTNDNTKLLTI